MYPLYLRGETLAKAAASATALNPNLSDGTPTVNPPVQSSVNPRRNPPLRRAPINYAALKMELGAHPPDGLNRREKTIAQIAILRAGGYTHFNGGQHRRVSFDEVVGDEYADNIGMMYRHVLASLSRWERSQH
jgi:hypothetical protein